MKYVILFTIGLTILFSRNAVSQDYYFSQFDQAPLVLNPALTGTINDSHRLNLNYRNQWASILQNNSYRTTSLSYDTQYAPTKSNIIGVGVSGVASIAGELNYQNKEAGLLLSYHKHLVQDTQTYHLIGLGLNFALANRNIDLMDARWPSQHNGSGGFNPNAPSPSEEIGRSETNYFNLGIGLLWQSIFSERVSFKLGYAMHHVNKPSLSTIPPNEVQLYVRSTVHGNAEIKLRKQLSLVPSFMYQTQGPHNQLMIGASAKWFRNRDKYSQFLQFGFWTRSGIGYNNTNRINSYIYSILYNFGKLQLGLSYDSINAINSGSIEVSMGYVFEKKKKSRVVYQPKEANSL